MPVYVYKNLNTGETFEVEQRITESAWTADPESGDPVKRIIQPVGIAFKGSGFYVNDSRASGPKAKNAKEKADSGSDTAGATGDGAAKAEGGSDTPGSKGAEGGKADGKPDGKSASSTKSDKA